MLSISGSSPRSQGSKGVRQRGMTSAILERRACAVLPFARMTGGDGWEERTSVMWDRTDRTDRPDRTRLRPACRAPRTRGVGDPQVFEDLRLQQADAARALQQLRDTFAGGRGGEVRLIDRALLLEHARRQRVGVLQAELVQPFDDAGEEDRPRPVGHRHQDLPEPAAGEGDLLVDRALFHPLGDVEHAEAMCALVARDEGRMRPSSGGRVALDPSKMLMPGSREELSWRSARRVVLREQCVDGHLRAEVDVSTARHLLEKAPIGEVVARPSIACAAAWCDGPRDRGGARACADVRATLSPTCGCSHAAEGAPVDVCLRLLGRARNVGVWRRPSTRGRSAHRRGRRNVQSTSRSKSQSASAPWRTARHPGVSGVAKMNQLARRGRHDRPGRTRIARAGVAWQQRLRELTPPNPRVPPPRRHVDHHAPAAATTFGKSARPRGASPRSRISCAGS